MTQPKADLVLKNGTVWTADSLTDKAEAVAIRGKEILAVGSNTEMDALIAPKTQVFDVRNALLLPGFNDAHTHFVEYSVRSSMTVDLYGVVSLDELKSRVREHAQAHPTTEWLIGNRWFPSRFEGGKWPTREDLDGIENQRPVAIFDVDGHSCWVNSCALEKLGFTVQTPDPVGGEIVRDESGKPTGILLENAHQSVPRSPTVTGDEFVQLFNQEVEKLNRLGITSLSNHGIQSEHLNLLESMALNGKLSLRISEWENLTNDLSEAKALRERFADSEIIRIGSLKAFVDGVLSSHTAWMLEPYADAPDKIGFPVTDIEKLIEQVVEADRQGFQLVIHAIGDRAVRECLNVYERVVQLNGTRERRHRIEHVEVVHPQDQERFAHLGVVASMMPMHCTADLEGYIKSRLGEPRAAYGYPWHNFINLGVHLCFGTDWPAIDLKDPNPLEQIFAAVTRTTPEAYPNSWHPEQRITVTEAIRCYTYESAYAEWMEHRKGSITPGKLADLCVLSRNILDGDPRDILDTEVVMTIFNGEVVYSKEFST